MCQAPSCTVVGRVAVFVPLTPWTTAITCPVASIARSQPELASRRPTSPHDVAKPVSSTWNSTIAVNDVGDVGEKNRVDDVSRNVWKSSAPAPLCRVKA
jgi:hypothetical protein